MSSVLEVTEHNRRLAEQINAEARVDPRSPYARKYVGIANGLVAIVADTLDEVCDCLDTVEPNSERTFWFEAGLDYAKVEYIWGLI